MTKPTANTAKRERRGTVQSAKPNDVVIPLAEELTPWLDPWDVCRRFAPLSHLLFLDSADAHPSLGRYSFVSADPFRWLCLRQGQIVDNGAERRRLDPFVVLSKQMKQWHSETLAGLPPFQGGAAGLFGYDLCHHIERLPRPRHDEFAVPDLAVGLYDWVLAFDHQQQRAWILSTGFPHRTAQRRPHALERMQAVRRLLDHRGAITHTRQASPLRQRQPPLAEGDLVPLHPLSDLPGVFSNFARRDYLAAVARAIEYIHAGDCFQVNVAQR